MASIRFLLGDELLFVHRVAGGSVSIGRSDACDVALPGPEVSRTHCIVRRRAGEWEVVDRSRHGIVVDGEPVPEGGRAPLRDGSVVEVGRYRAELRLRPEPAGPTAPREPDRGHEEIAAAAGAVQVERAVLRVVDGPGAGAAFPLRSRRLSLGGPGSDLVLPDPALVPRHAWLRVARGRVMVEPGAGAAFVAGVRVRELLPLYEGERLRVGDTHLVAERRAHEDAPEADRFGGMVGRSPAMRRLFGVLRRIAGHHHPVLVTGESGTGKELAARALHDCGPRAGGPFVAVNCGAVPEELFESELFGHEKGAFTGADRRRDGAFQEAHGGTLFLDEVGELSEAAQAKLLRVLETGEVRRVGGGPPSYPDVRIVAATNRDLAAEVAAGRFRQALFFRLAVLVVEIPPLRERPEDVEPLARHLLAAIDPSAHLAPDALERLRGHDWPGNVRELRNVLVRACVLGGPTLRAADLRFHRFPAPAPPPGSGAARLDPEAVLLADLMRRHGGNRTSAARELGIPRSTLHYKLRKHGLA